MTQGNSHAQEQDRIDRALLENVAQECHISFSKLYRRYYTPVTRFAYRYLQAPQIIEEVVNDTMLVVWQKSGQFRGDSRVSTWIMGIAVRKCWEASKKIKNTEVSIDELPELTDINVEMQGAEVTQTLQWGMQQLTKEHRATVELAYHQGYTCEEISTIMDCPRNTVKTRLHYARKALKKILGDVESGLDNTQQGAK